MTTSTKKCPSCGSHVPVQKHLPGCKAVEEENRLRSHVVLPADIPETFEELVAGQEPGDLAEGLANLHVLFEQMVEQGSRSSRPCTCWG